MGCRTAWLDLLALADGESSGAPGRYWRLLGHLSVCRRCRSEWLRLRQERRAFRRLPAPQPAADLRERLRTGVAALAPHSAPPRPTRAPGLGAATRMRLATAGAALLLIGLLLLHQNLTRPVMAAGVRTALTRANTWRLVGWRQDGPRRTACTVYGRRLPFFYREQSGDELLLDNGESRLQVLPQWGGRLLALRTASQPALEVNRWAGLTRPEAWREAPPPWRVEPDRVIFRTTDAGMQGPGSVAYDYYTVDRRTWLPLSWEYRHVRAGKEVVVEHLDAEYGVPLPPSVTTGAPPAGARVVDTLARPDAPSGARTHTAGAITVSPIVEGVDREGQVVVRLRSWLGNEPLGAEGGALYVTVGFPIWARTVGLKPPVEAAADERGTPYVLEEAIRTGIPHSMLTNGEQLLWFAPLEPPAPGAPPARRLTVHLTVSVQAGVLRGDHMPSRVLTREEFTLSLALSAPRAPFREQEFVDPTVPPRERFLEDVPFAVRLAGTRARSYRVRRNFAREEYWLQEGIRLSAPDGNQAQYLRLNLVHVYWEADQPDRARAMAREVLQVRQRYPRTAEHYARVARYYLTRKPRSSRAPRLKEAPKGPPGPADRNQPGSGRRSARTGLPGGRDPSAR
ncbi:MAG: hypothetical protein FJX77_03330 [Armatimonadetes bacterium]|nr:hypothetical protein [Armatimonadota bacterium]